MPHLYAVLLGTLILSAPVWSQNSKTSPAPVDAPMPVTQKEKTAPHPDINIALQNDVDFLQKKFDQLSVDKGYAETAGLFLHQVAPMFDHVRTLVGRTLVAKDTMRQIQTHIAELQEQLKKEQSVVSDFEAQTSAVVDHIKITLHKVDEIVVGDPEHYPERCGIMISEDALRKEGLESYQGVIEKFNKKWVLTFVDSKAPDGVKRFNLDEMVGLVGSKDHNAGFHVMGLTPQGMFVTGLYNPKTQTVVCVSQAHDASSQEVVTSAQGAVPDKTHVSQGSEVSATIVPPKQGDGENRPDMKKASFSGEVPKGSTRKVRGGK